MKKKSSKTRATKYNKGYALDIKAKLVDYLLSEYSAMDVIIASEVPVCGKQSIIDMMVIGVDFLIGYEIKSDYDTLFRLDKQIDSYNGCFNSVYLVCGENVAKQKIDLKQSIGIMKLTDEQIYKKRKAKNRKYPLKEKIVEFLWKKDVPCSYNEKDLPVSELKKKLCETATRDELLSLVVHTLRKRYEPRFESFMKARGQVTCIQDVEILTMQNTYIYEL